MTDGEKWWNETTRKLQKEPEYLAAGLSLEIATKVNQSMLATGMGQKDFAAKLGVSQPYVSQVLAGKTNLTIMTLCKLAVALDVSPVKLLGAEARVVVYDESAQGAVVSALRLVSDTAVQPAESAAERPTQSTSAAVHRDTACLESAAETCTPGLLTA